MKIIAYTIGTNEKAVLPNKAWAMFVFDGKWWLYETSGSKILISESSASDIDDGSWDKLGYKRIELSQNEIDNLKIQLL